MKRSCLSLLLLLLLPMAVQAGDRELDTLRRQLHATGAEWKAGDNPIWRQYVDNEEGNRAETRMPEYDDGLWIAPEPRRDLPSHFDWRDYQGENWVTPIKDQGLCGGCSAFAAVASLETQILWDLQDPELDLDLSEQHLFSCSGNGDCAAGMVMGLAMMYLRQHGVPDEDCFPYYSIDGGNHSCEETCTGWEDRAYRIQSWNWVYHFDDFDRIKTAIMEGPLYSYIGFYEDFYAYESGIYTHVWGNGPIGHGVSIIGWDDDEQYWIGKNSWTDQWGEDGFFRIRWGEASIETYMGRMVWEPEPTDDDDDDDDNNDDDSSNDDDNDNNNDDNDNNDNNDDTGKPAEDDNDNDDDTGACGN